MYFEDVLPDLRNGAIIQRSGAQFCMQNSKIYRVLENKELELFDNISGTALCADDWKIFKNAQKQSSYKPKPFKELAEKLCEKYDCVYIMKEAENLISKQDWKAYDRYHNTNKQTLRGYTQNNGIDAAWRLVYGMLCSHMMHNKALNVEVESEVKLISSYHDGVIRFELSLVGITNG